MQRNFVSIADETLNELMEKRNLLRRLMILGEGEKLFLEVSSQSRGKIDVTDFIDSEDVRQTIYILLKQQLDKKVEALKAELADYLKIKEEE
ncbi:MAG TPA: hypothetical protein GXX75_23490 [Clostridiales bacterium]|nr:hypothetical protein [Clostridiales bacterium]